MMNPWVPAAFERARVVLQLPSTKKCRLFSMPPFSNPSEPTPLLSVNGPDDGYWMRLALEQASLAATEGEVPVGAVVVKAGVLLATGRNAPIARHDPTAHAEIVALRAAAQVLGNYRLEGCTLYVTLEPCAMCSGAMLHARVDRVVFGATDAKTGAAGSVLNLFELAALNHQTTVTGGVLAAECADLLKAFFRPRRVNRHPLREDALRTPVRRLEGLPDFPWAPAPITELPSLQGLRLCCLDEGPQGPDNALTFLCLHDSDQWGYTFRHLVPAWLKAGARVVVPDLIGFGRSDKPKKESVHTPSFHRQVLLELLNHLDLRNTVLVGQGWGAVLALSLPVACPDRFNALVLLSPRRAVLTEWLGAGGAVAPVVAADLNANPSAEAAPTRADKRDKASKRGAHAADISSAAQAPFPDAGYRAALRAFHSGGPAQADAQWHSLAPHVIDYWTRRWHGHSRVLVTAPATATSRGAVGQMGVAIESLISGCPPSVPWAPGVLEQPALAEAWAQELLNWAQA